MGPLILSRATEADMPEIAAVEYRSFSPFIREMFMGCRSEADIPRLADWYARRLRSDPFDVWIKVVDAATGRLVAASEWKVCPNGPGPDDEPPEWLEGESLERSRRMMGAINAARRKANPAGYVRKSPFFPSPFWLMPGLGFSCCCCCCWRY